MMLPKLMLPEEDFGAVVQRCITAGLRFCVANSDRNGPLLFYELHVDFVFLLISGFHLENVLVWKGAGESLY